MATSLARQLTPLMAARRSRTLLLSSRQMGHRPPDQGLVLTLRHRRSVDSRASTKSMPCLMAALAPKNTRGSFQRHLRRHETLRQPSRCCCPVRCRRRMGQQQSCWPRATPSSSTEHRYGQRCFHYQPRAARRPPALRQSWLRSRSAEGPSARS